MRNSIVCGAFGNLVQTKDALQNSIAASFDYRRTRTQLADPDKGLVKTESESFGQLVWQERARPHVGGCETHFRLLTGFKPNAGARTSR